MIDANLNLLDFERKLTMTDNIYNAAVAKEVYRLNPTDENLRKYYAAEELAHVDRVRKGQEMMQAQIDAMSEEEFKGFREDYIL